MTIIPTIPTNLSCSMGLYTDRIRLLWDKPVHPQGSSSQFVYVVERSLNKTNSYSIIGLSEESKVLNDKIYFDDMTDQENRYWYKLRAFDSTSTFYKKYSTGIYVADINHSASSLSWTLGAAKVTSKTRCCFFGPINVSIFKEGDFLSISVPDSVKGWSCQIAKIQYVGYSKSSGYYVFYEDNYNIVTNNPSNKVSTNLSVSWISSLVPSAQVSGYTAEVRGGIGILETPPAVPSNLVVKSGTEEITLSWDIVERASKYIVYYSKTDSNYRKLATLGNNSFGYIHNCGKEREYFYKIIASNKYGVSSPSESKSGSTKQNLSAGFEAIFSGSNSFTNEIEVCLKSAVNERTNVQQHNRFFKMYKYIDLNDFQFNLPNRYGAPVTGNVSLVDKYFELGFILKSSVFIKINDGKNISDEKHIVIEEMSEKDIHARHTSMEFPEGLNLFVQSFKNTEKYTLKRSSGSDVQSAYYSFSDDVYKGARLVGFSGENIVVFKVMKSTGSKLILKGLVKKQVLSLNKMALFHFLPESISFSFSDSYQGKKYLAKIQSITDDGILCFKPIGFEIESNLPTKIYSNFRDSNENFGGFTKNVDVGGESIFYYSGVLRSEMTINGYIDTLAGASISSKNPPSLLKMSMEGDLFNKLSIPSMYKNNILHIKVSAPTADDVISLNIFDNNGTSESYSSTVPGKIEIDSSNNNFYIRVDQSKFNYFCMTVSITPKE